VNENIRVVIADDHPLMRAALKEAVRTRIADVEIAEASSVRRCSTCWRHRPTST
jgi:DNA-binding NarL/FixJ family response regulator